MDNQTTKGGIKGWFSRHKPSKRRLIQVYAALLYNANLKGFSTGKIYTGETKKFCVPGLNCYSCPGAVGACPLGSLQNALASSSTSSVAYVFGILVLLGLLLGRAICGFLCPFGLIQELLHKIPSPKLKKNKVTKVFSYFKYVILGVFVVMIPLAFSTKLPVPGFCKYICPDGTLIGAIAMLVNPSNADMFSMLGPLFTWKFCLLVVFLVSSVFIYRFFCRFFCPLGAIYGFFCKVAMLGVKLDEDKCIACGKCVEQCQMDIRHVGDHECIHCGKCIDVCPTKAIRWKGSKIFLAKNEVQKDASAEQIAQVEAHNAKVEKKRKICRIVAAVLAVALLIGAFWYYWPKEPEKDFGYEVGSYCPEFSLPLIGSEGTVSLSDFEGKVVVINFWANWCGPCKNELPHFNQFAADYADDVAIIAISVDSLNLGGFTDSYIESMKNLSMQFVEETDLDHLYTAFDATDAISGSSALETIGHNRVDLPVTLVLDREGKIIFYTTGGLEYDELLAAVAPAL